MSGPDGLPNWEPELEAFGLRPLHIRNSDCIKAPVAIETTIKVLDHANILLNLATNDSYEDENEGVAVESKANNNGAANAVEAKVINRHAEQKAIYQMMLPYL
ncbi:hypothetical protein MAM1_0003d00394 [Mucor ambiguus]|uniref:Uncharacterized protein n=1 Tax=Mucor ambiguus TaxID=91626 RepID=A0A0C9LZW8_9FUNG|nr:hypothetical protein MAM1_0003d00394 [Mucor ambiguus]